MALSVRGRLAALEKQAQALPDPNAGLRWIGDDPAYWRRIVQVWQGALRNDSGGDLDRPSALALTQASARWSNADGWAIRMAYPFWGSEDVREYRQRPVDWPAGCQGEDWRDHLSPAECCLCVGIQGFGKRLALPEPWPCVLALLERLGRVRQRMLAEVKP